MTGASRILDALLGQDLLLTLEAGQLRVVSPLGQPLPEALRTQIAVYRAEIVAELTWRAKALDLLTDCLARVERQYAPGCSLDGDELRHLEAEVTAAFWSGDHLRLQHGLRDYRLACWTRFSAARGRGP